MRSLRDVFYRAARIIAGELKNPGSPFWRGMKNEAAAKVPFASPLIDLIERAIQAETFSIERQDKLLVQTCLQSYFIVLALKLPEYDIKLNPKVTKSLEVTLKSDTYSLDDFAKASVVAEFGFFKDVFAMTRTWLAPLMDQERIERLIEEMKRELASVFPKVAPLETLTRLEHWKDYTERYRSEERWRRLARRVAELEHDDVFGTVPLKDIFIHPDWQMIKPDHNTEEITDKGVCSFIDGLFNEYRELIIVNEFGMGKSSVMKVYASHLANEYINDVSGKARFPVFLPLGELLRRRTLGDIEKEIVGYLERQLGSSISPNGRLPTDKNFCFIFDGLDETYRDTWEEIKDDFHSLGSVLQEVGSKVIITTRPGILAQIPLSQKTALMRGAGKLQLSIKEFSQEKIDGWLKKWHQKTGGKRITYENLRARKLEQIAGTPILLFMTAEIFPEKLKEEKGYKRAEVYTEFIKKVIHGKYVKEKDHKKPYKPSTYLNEKEYHQVLKELACATFTWGKGLSNDEIVPIVGRTVDRETLAKCEDRVVQAALTCHFFTQTGNLWHFAHSSIMEFLCAERSLNILLNASDPVQVKASLCGRVPTQPIIDFLKELISSQSLSFAKMKKLLRLLKEIYSSWDLLVQVDDKILNNKIRDGYGQVYIAMPQEREKGLNARVLGLILFIYVSSLQSGSPGNLDKIESSDFRVREFFALCWLREKRIVLDNLSKANLERAYLRGADLTGADLRGANLEGADLRGADLWGTNLRGANLEGAYLWGTNLRGANLEGAYLRGAYLRGAYLEDIRNWDKVLSFKGTIITKARGLSSDQVIDALRRGAIQE